MGYSETILFGLASILFFTVPCLTQGCTTDWFGNNCQYKCHCLGDSCQSSGECEQGVGCDRGWFGPACQYADLSYTNSTTSTANYLRDGNDTTCNSDSSAQSANITLTGQFPFTWFRMRVKDPGDLHQAFTLQFKNISSTSRAECENMKTAFVDDQTFDIYCDVPLTADQVILTGDVVKSLCSLYISGERNVALRQRTWQATHYSWVQDNSLAVDGNTRGQEFDCTHTILNGIKEDARWGVTLLQPVKVNRYMLYNRQTRISNGLYCCRERLQGFILTGFAQSGQQVFYYQDKDLVPRNVYTVTSPSSTLLVSQVNITATHFNATDGIVLTLCEVEIYGDSVCPNGMYGRECEARCNCAGGSECFVTGGCPAGCAPGYQGETCITRCPDGRFGINCKEKCSTSCIDQKCNYVSGDCDKCPIGKKGKQCEEDCDPNTWGERCVHDCSINCLNQLCNATTGICFKCPPGKLGLQCDIDCPPHYYGDNCSVPCSNICVNQECNGTSGFCTSCPVGKIGKECEDDCPFSTFGEGCKQICSKNCGDDGSCHPVSGECSRGCVPGYTGATCEKVCDLGKYGKDCSKDCSENCNANGTAAGQSPCDHITGVCIRGCQNGYHDLLCVASAEDESSGLVTGLGVGIAILVILLVVGAVVSVYCYRRRSRAADGSGQRRRPGYDDVDMTRQDDHTYRTMYKSDDGYDLPRNVTTDEATGNDDYRTRSTAQYENVDVGHYESVTGDDPSDDTYEPIVQEQPTVPTEGNDNSGYINVEVR